MARVLVVDDDSDVRLLVSRKLEKEFEIETAQAVSGHSSAEVLLQSHFDLVVSDVQMPDGSGLWLHAFMKQWMPDVPLILFTSIAVAEMPAQDNVLRATVSKWEFPSLIDAIHRLGKFHEKKPV